MDSKLNQLDSGSKFTGSIDVSGSITIDGIYIGDGSGLRNIDIANLAIDTSRIYTGSVTASVATDGYFRVLDGTTLNAVKSEFSGSVYVSESLYVNKFIFGDGSYITNVIAAASPRIASGSVTASVSPEVWI
jgi:cytoskeletal protein CcmA (bactofilin family)